MSNQRTLDQERAGFAWDCIQKIKKEVFDGDAKKQENYCSLARKAPADIQINGFGQTLAFWYAKGSDNKGNPDPKTPDYQILQHVTGWLNSPKGMNLAKPDLVKWISREAQTADYRRATTETIAFLVWLKRFAEAELP
jgi:CRISPR-associated protein Cmr5